MVVDRGGITWWRSEIRKKTKADKKRWMMDQITEGIDQKERWNGSKTLRNDYKQNVYARKDKDGNEISLEDRSEAMAAYLEEVHWGKERISNSSRGSHGEETESSIAKLVRERVEKHLDKCRQTAVTNVEMDRPFEIAEMDRCIKHTKRNKAAGTDNLTTDWLQDLNQRNRDKLLTMINKWWLTKEWASKMEEARIAALYKKGDPEKPENYRPLSLLNTLFKLMAAMMKRRIEDEVEHVMGETQFGFRRGKSTTHAIYIARRVQEFAERAGMRAQFVFLDWEKAFDKIEHTWLIKALESYGLPEG